jgi:phosphonate degradation associated HDIG domain protein
MSPALIVQEIARLYAERGHLHYGEGVTELEHALQAADLANQAGELPELVVACLLHDIGHLSHDLGEGIAEQGVDAGHEELSAQILAAWFGPEVAEPARLHVAAKRYLCRVDPDYLETLSAPSVLSLRLQGGPLSIHEAEDFARNPHHAAAVRLRRYDDLAKVPGKPVPGLEAYSPWIMNISQRWQRSSSL